MLSLSFILLHSSLSARLVPISSLAYSFTLITHLLHYVLPLCVTMTPKSPFHIVYVYANDDYNPPALFRKDTGWSVCSSRPFTLLFKVCLPLCSCATHYILPLGLFILSAIHSDTFPTLRFEHGHQPPLLGERCEVGVGFSESRLCSHWSPSGQVEPSHCLSMIHCTFGHRRIDW